MSQSELPPQFADLWTEQDRADALSLQGPIWVVGGGGFVGSKLFFSLSRLRGDVYAVSSGIESSWRLLGFPSARRISLDITSREDVAQAVRTWRPKTVFNLAAYGGDERQADPIAIHRVNYLGALHLLLALSERGCEAFVMAGSSSEYGWNRSGPPESDPIDPNSDYAVAKASAALLLQFYGKSQSFPCAHLRLYSVYGPWEERHRLIPRLVALGLEGQWIPFADPDTTRDFVYVDDGTRAFVRAALLSCRQRPGSIYNIASGIKTSLADVARQARECLPIPGEPRFGSMARRKWDLGDWYGNPAKARAELQWETRTAFAAGLQLTADWERRFGAHFRHRPAPPARTRLSAVVACYRDDLAIPQMHARLTQVLQKLDLDYEIIFVNDHSPGGDEEAIRRLCRTDPRVLGISHSRNFGSQSSFLSGLGLATGDAAVILDGDLQDPPELIEAFVAKWREGHDVVYGIRRKREAAWHMQILYKMFYRLFRRLADIQVPVDAGDFCLLNRRAFEQLLQFPERDAFLRGLRAWMGLRQTGVEYLRPERPFGRSTNSFLKNLWWAKKAVFSFSLKPLYYIQAVGLGIFCLSALLALFYLAVYFLAPEKRVPGVITIVLLVLGVGGIQLFSLSIIGDYIGKILEEVKRRPKFIRARLLLGDDTIDSPAEIARLADSRSGRRARSEP